MKFWEYTQQLWKLTYFFLKRGQLTRAIYETKMRRKKKNVKGQNEIWNPKPIHSTALKTDARKLHDSYDSPKIKIIGKYKRLTSLATTCCKRIILKQILTTHVTLWARTVCLRTAASGGLFWTRQWTSDLKGTRVISWLAGWMSASQEVTCTMTSLIFNFFHYYYVVRQITGYSLISDSFRNHKVSHRLSPRRTAVCGRTK
jgi:hypothetical protein